jgi:hypothetical protein
VTILAAASNNAVAPGTLGFLVVFGMAVVLFFLFRSMSKHLRKVNAAARKEEAGGSPESKSDNDDADATAASSGAPGPGDRRGDS